MRFSRTLLIGGAMAATAVLSLGAASRPWTPPDPSWLAWNPATRTVTFKLIAGLTGSGAKSPFNFNGYVDGELTLVVPDSASMVMNFVNQDGTPHSAVVIADQDPMPNMAETPAIPRAFTVKASEGLGSFQKDALRFRATPPGGYRIFCGVPGHGLSGMWIRLKIDPEATAPSMVETLHDPRAK